MSALNTALELAEKYGFHVFPIRIYETPDKLEKRPFSDSNGFNDATNDRDRIEHLFTMAEKLRKPHEEIGIAHVPGLAGFVVIDLDQHSADKDGVAFAEKLNLPPTFKVATATGSGVHLYYRKKDLDTVVPSSKPWGENAGIDIRSNNGYAVAPGTSTRFGEWSPTLDSFELDDVAVIPDTIWARVTATKASQESTAKHDPTQICDVPQTINAAIDSAIANAQQITAAKSRSTNFVEIVKSCATQGLNLDTTYSAMKRWNTRFKKYPTKDLWIRVEEVWMKEKNQIDWINSLSEMPQSPSVEPFAVDSDIDPPLFVTRSFNTIEPKEIEWFVGDLIPKREVVLFVGDEGIGKGLFTCHLAAVLTTSENPLNVLFIAAEDDPERVLSPRLEAAGADLNRCKIIASDAETMTGVPLFPTHAANIEQSVIDNEIKVIIVDPWISTVPPGLSVKDSQQARQVLDPWTRFVRRLGITVVAVSHTNRTNGSTRDRVGSTGVLRQVARVQLLALQDPQKPDSVWVGVDKSNLGIKPPAVEYRKESHAGSVRAIPTGSTNYLTIAELDGTFNIARDGRVTDKWADVVAAADGGMVTRQQVVEIYGDAADPESAANKAIHRWKNSTPAKLTPVRGQRGVFEVSA